MKTKNITSKAVKSASRPAKTGKTVLTSYRQNGVIKFAKVTIPGEAPAVRVFNGEFTKFGAWEIASQWKLHKHIQNGHFLLLVARKNGGEASMIEANDLKDAVGFFAELGISAKASSAVLIAAGSERTMEPRNFGLLHPHTPGPWMACLNVPTAQIPGHIIKTSKAPNSPVASIWKGGGTKGVGTMISNAYLIAAAPDLLTALEAMVEEAELEGGASRFYSKIIDRAYLAIRKARNSKR